MKIRIIAVTLAISILGGGITACATKQDTGALLGGLAGGVVANRFGGGTGKVLLTLAGTLAGAWAGSSIGKHMDDHDRRVAANNLHERLERAPTDNGWTQQRWNNNGRTYQSDTYAFRESNMPANCRRFEQKVFVTIDGRPERATTSGIACKDPRTGEWQIEKQ